MPKFIDRTGARFGRLTALRRNGSDRTTGEALWECTCDCGGHLTVRGSSLSSGNTGSCGCLPPDNQRALFTTHNMHTSRTYHSWQHMKTRCYNPRHIGYKDYGGRGIAVCDRWRHSFENFLADMGERPPGHTIGRIDHDKPYEPGNCQWETRRQQGRSKLGTGNPRARLTPKDVREIRTLLAGGDFTHTQIGRMFGVTKGAIWGIASGQTWKHVA